MEKVIEGAYEVLGIFDRVEEKRDAMQSLMSNSASTAGDGESGINLSLW